MHSERMCCSCAQVNIFDLSLQLRMNARPSMKMADQYMTAAGASKQVSSCSSRRQLRGSVLQRWQVNCPSSLSLGSCQYDCNSAAACMWGMAPTLAQAIPDRGAWYNIPLPASWSTVSVLFTEQIRECIVVDCAQAGTGLASYSTMLGLEMAEVAAQCNSTASPWTPLPLRDAWFHRSCVHMIVNSVCDAENFGVNPATKLMSAAPSVVLRKTASVSRSVCLQLSTGHSNY